MTKKAKVLLNNKVFIIDINEDLDYKRRIIEELSIMGLECCPILHPKEKNKNLPISCWSEEDFYNEDYEKIWEILDEKLLEYHLEFETLINDSLDLKLKEKNQSLNFMDSYIVSKEEQALGFTTIQKIEVHNNDESLLGIEKLLNEIFTE